jgi:hypothetical protein
MPTHDRGTAMAQTLSAVAGALRDGATSMLRRMPRGHASPTNAEPVKATMRGIDLRSPPTRLPWKSSYRP